MADLLFKLLPILLVLLVPWSPGPTKRSWSSFCHHMFTSFQSLILEPGFCDSGEAWDTTAFLQTRDRQRTWWEGSVLGRSNGVLMNSSNEHHVYGVCLHNTDRLMSNTDTKNNFIKYFMTIIVITVTQVN